MTLKFYYEEIMVKGQPVVGHIEVEARATDASFSHEFGLEVVEDVEFSFDNFEHISGWVPGTIDFVMPALNEWMEENTDKMQKLFDNTRHMRDRSL